MNFFHAHIDEWRPNRRHKHQIAIAPPEEPCRAAVELPEELQQLDTEPFERVVGGWVAHKTEL